MSFNKEFIFKKPGVEALYEQTWKERKLHLKLIEQWNSNRHAVIVERYPSTSLEKSARLFVRDLNEIALLHHGNNVSILYVLTSNLHIDCINKREIRVEQAKQVRRLHHPRDLDIYFKDRQIITDEDDEAQRVLVRYAKLQYNKTLERIRKWNQGERSVCGCKYCNKKEALKVIGDASLLFTIATGADLQPLFVGKAGQKISILREDTKKLPDKKKK